MEEVSHREPLEPVDQVEVVDLLLAAVVEPVEQEIHPLKVHLQHPFKDMLVEVERVTPQVVAAVVAALRQ